jgi:hypothetical protein
MTHPQGRLQERKRVFTGGFPHLVKEFIASHLIPVIPTAGEEASVAAAHATDRVRQGGRQYGISGFQLRRYEYGYNLPCARDALV